MHFCEKTENGRCGYAARSTFPFPIESESTSVAGPVADFQSSFQVQLLGLLGKIESHLGRIADASAPAEQDVVGTPYVAKRLGQTTTWIAEMARRGLIPKSCVVAGTGIGKPWKFHRAKIDEWIETR